MANNYTQFSEMIPCGTKEQQDWLMQKLGEAVETEERLMCPDCDFAADKGNVWVYSQDVADVGALADVVAAFQLQFGVDEPWTLTWAGTCSKPRVSQFGGGGVVAYKGKVHWMNTWDWCTAEAKRLQGEAP